MALRTAVLGLGEGTAVPGEDTAVLVEGIVLEAAGRILEAHHTGLEEAAGRNPGDRRTGRLVEHHSHQGLGWSFRL